MSTSSSQKKLRPAANSAPQQSQTLSSKPALNRQSTPFSQSKSSSSRGSKRKKEEEPEAIQESEEEEEDDAQMESASDDDAAESDAAHKSLAAQFDAAGEDSESDGGDESSDDDGQESGAEEEEAEADLPLKKKQRGDTGSAVSASAAPAAPKAPKVLQIRVTTDSELQFHLKQLHRLMKKLRAFATKKAVRRLKDSKALGAPVEVLAQLQSDLECTKHFNLEHMALYAWRIYNLQITGKKMPWDADTALAAPITIEKANATAASNTAAAVATPAAATSASAAAPSPRLRELLSQVLYSPACKKSCSEYIAAALKRSRKSGQREKKIEQMAETAAKRKEKEKKAREKAEAKAKKRAAAKAEKKEGEKKKQDGDDDASSSESEAEDKSAAAAAVPAKTKKAAAAAASSSSSDSESESDARDSKREEKLKRREKLAQKAAATAAAESNGATPAASVATSKPAVDRRANQGTDSSSGDSASSSSSSDSDASIGAPKKKKSTKSTLASGKPSRVFSGLCVGKLVSGVVSGVEKFGLFIEFWYKKKERKGLCHISMVSDSYISDLSAQFARGDTVHAIVTKLDEKSGRISLGLKASLFPEGKKPKPALHTSKTAVAPVDKPKGASGEQKEGKLESLFMDTLHAPKSAAEGADAAKLENIKKFLTQVSSTGAARTVTTGANKNRLGQRERRKLITAVLGAEATTKTDAGAQNGKHLQAWKRKQLEREAEKKGAVAPVFAKHDQSAAPAAAVSSSKPDLSGIPTTPSASSSAGENRRAKRLKMHADALAAGQQINPLAAAAVAAAAAGVTRGPRPPKPAAAANAAAPSASASSSSASRPPSSSAPRAPRPASAAAAAPRAAAPARAAPAAAAPTLSTEEMHPSWQAKQMQAAKAAAAPQGKKIRFD